MMSQHLTSVFEQIGNFTKNNLTCSNANNKLAKEKDKEKEQTQHQNHQKVTNHTTVVNHAAGGSPAHHQRPVGGHQLAPLKKPLKLKNVCSKAEAYDSLHFNSALSPLCTEATCLGSVMGIPGRGDEPREVDEILRQAKEFLDQYFASIRRANSPAHESRWQAVQAEVAALGTYQLTETELVYGAKSAWRNAPRCIGRIQWSKLQVFDCRYVTTTSGMFEALCNHIKYSTNKGNIRSAITVFPQRTDASHDYRIWNSQLITYAGYKNPDGTIIGDPMHIEFTELCMKLGWKPAKTAWDILPLVLSSNGKDPDFFDVPRDLVMEIQFTHPTYEWFKDLDLRWYALPAVSNMRFDCGGIEFTANAFNGWYMATEIACRDICDVNRLNMTEIIALKMGLDTRSPVSLWKDKALVEANIAVLHSFQQRNVTIVDHHTASESFMKHLDNESRLRSGCPSDWVWIVPPMSSSLTPVFHQEMALYYLKPSYDYQDPAWKTHRWQKNRLCERGSSAAAGKKPRRKFHFKQIARAVKFTSKLFGRALSRRIKATVLYATETGKSEQYAKKLGIIFGHAFNAQVHCMSDYDISSIEHEALLLVVTSTFGNGDPPENGEIFAKDLYSLRMNNDVSGDDNFGVQMQTPKSFIKANSQGELMDKDMMKTDTLRGSLGDPADEHFGPLSNVRFAVFALGSSAYPNFCAFGKYVDNLLGELGGERIMKMEHGDEMCGQDQAFRKWATEVFHVACETFCLDDDSTLKDVTDALGTVTLSEDTVRFTDPEIKAPEPILKTLQTVSNRKIFACPITQLRNLHCESTGRCTMFVEFKTDDDFKYQPGDHVGVLPCNRSALVEDLISRLKGVRDPDVPLQLQQLKENHTSNGVERTWESHERLPTCTLREIFTRFVDITTPPTTNLLHYLSTCCTEEEDKHRLEILSTDTAAYEDWRHWSTPTLVDTLRQFESARPHAALLAAQLMPLQPRFYSISSSPLAHKGVLHVTVAVVTYQTQDGKLNYGVCSNFLKDCKPGDEVYMFVRSAPSFHLPQDTSLPILLVGPGTGVAPFRSFWHHRREQETNGKKLGPAWLFFGCRNKQMDLYCHEKAQMQKEGVLSRVFLALSREEGVPKTYVQGLAEQEGAEIFKMLVELKGHFYVCGDCTMAEHVYQTLKKIIKKHGNYTDQEIENFMLKLRDENRYHEDIFGITLRTAEIQNKSRESARIRMATQP
ncbi:nitric oxide synthase [Arctopsyche grandis]|uniref:nitric oxide synthase n=1 Tax=Arctopsyche grandis TaxID=121162 RepID=UPI00406D69DF